jgi:bifunctional DNA-binding transcriptional regulator/antitoxin component of YhaV-PrlF toxin-antitoxin module
MVVMFLVAIEIIMWYCCGMATPIPAFAPAVTADLLESAHFEVVPIDAAGRVVVPARLRKSLGLEGAGELVIFSLDGELRVTTRARARESARRLVKSVVRPGRNLADELLADRQAAAEQENLR